MKIAPMTITLSIAVAIAAMATAPVMSQQQYSQNDGSQSKPCNTAGAAVAGALIGALLGGKNNRGRGAAIGGAVGAIACVSINYHARQVKTAQQVSQEYQNQNGGNLPQQSALLQYQTRINPGNRIQPGQSSSLDSDIEVVQGTDGVKPVIEEEITLIGPDGKQLKNVRKPANEGSAAGAFQTQFAFTLPQGVQEGNYQFKTVLYMNGQPVRDSQLPLQVVNASM